MARSRLLPLVLAVVVPLALRCLHSPACFTGLARLSPSQRARAAARRAGDFDIKVENRVFVNNLDWRATWEDLKEHMREAGEVKFAKIFEQKDGRSKGCGTVEFESPESVQTAISMLNGSMLWDREITLRPDEPQERKTPFPSDGRGVSRQASDVSRQVSEYGKGRLVHVSGLQWNVAWQDLKDMLSGYGNVLRCNLAQGPGGQCKGFAKAVYETEEQAQRAIEILDGMDWQSRRLTLRLIDPTMAEAEDMGPRGEKSRRGKQSHAKSENIYFGYGQQHSLADQGRLLHVSGLPWQAAWQDVKDVFKKYGTIIRCNIAETKQGDSKGYGTVLFETEEQAQAAIKGLDQADFWGRAIGVRLFDLTNTKKTREEAAKAKEKEAKWQNVLEAEQA